MTTTCRIVALSSGRIFSRLSRERETERKEGNVAIGRKKRGEDSSPFGRTAIPSLFRERVRGPPNQFQLESGIFAGQAQRSPWKGLLAVLSYYGIVVGRKSSTGPYRIHRTTERSLCYPLCRSPARARACVCGCVRRSIVHVCKSTWISSLQRTYAER